MLNQEIIIKELTKGLKTASSSHDMPADIGPGGSKLSLEN